MQKTGLTSLEEALLQTSSSLVEFQNSYVCKFESCEVVDIGLEMYNLKSRKRGLSRDNDALMSSNMLPPKVAVRVRTHQSHESVQAIPCGRRRLMGRLQL